MGEQCSRVRQRETGESLKNGFGNDILVNEGGEEYVGDSLAQCGYRKTETECHQRDCEGTLWYDDHTLVCGDCSHAVDLDQRRRLSLVKDPWERYREERPTYHYSKKPRMPGGFLHPYDWVASDDIDGAVTALPGESFYK